MTNEAMIRAIVDNTRWTKYATVVTAGISVINLFLNRSED